jgi:hypothetical protein
VKRAAAIFTAEAFYIRGVGTVDRRDIYAWYRACRPRMRLGDVPASDQADMDRHKRILSPMCCGENKNQGDNLVNS